MIEQASLEDLMKEDLARSGLGFEDMFTRIMDNPERNMLGLPSNASGYIIPYYNIYGKQEQFYRAKIFKGEPKYRQAKGTPNHVYFPPNFRKVFLAAKKSMVILTEGEKKAALACKLGIPAVAFGGADSWQNRTILLPKEAELSAYSHNRTLISAKLPSVMVDESIYSVMATGLQELLDICLSSGTILYIIFDTDSQNGLSYQVQRAAAKLGLELRFKGFSMAQIKQLILPYVEGRDEDTKVGLDDFLINEDGGVEYFMRLLEICRNSQSAFPKHPNIREHINKQLQRPKLDRKQTQNISLSVIAEMDAKGRRMYSPQQSQLFYFDSLTNALMKVNVNDGDLQSMQETPFGRLMYRDYGISPAADDRILKWFGAQFAAEDPIEEVEPQRIIAAHKDGEDLLRYQINDGQYIEVSGNPMLPWRIVNNGTNNVLFESNLVKPINAKTLEAEMYKRAKEQVKCWWREVLKGARLKDKHESLDLHALLYYLSPWLNRWRGMQLPVEMSVGEAGSGKSTLSEIRLNIITGEAKLRNAPNDLKDWNAAIANSGGLHVTDNVHLMDKTLKQRMSDELCRLVTDPHPRIEMRKYFTEADQRVFNVSAVFGFTAIQQPFTNADLLQRAVILDFDKNVKSDNIANFSFDSYWKQHQISNFGGRTAWISHHMHIMHLFFKKVKEKWNPTYKSKHRLVNLEQSLRLMAEVFGMNGDWIPDYLENSANTRIGRSDWVLEGLIHYAENIRRTDKQWHIKKYSAQDMSNWFMNHEDFEKNITLTNSRSLGRYLSTNTHNLLTIVGIEEHHKVNNRMMYRVIADPNMAMVERMNGTHRDREEIAAESAKVTERLKNNS